ncbi:hypothetical protein BDW02DRAFT_341858 [Decorospora gaudefroyi]|uniref:Uncharacterized protein n=1 Tax=Decorospora gaudefroyi TaxID=184978 RepID=A0A6A5KEE1_9PLEO|nr:hypothetical protein BDW02DRAFT_341858 [Decorospora gaudefroyi]
MRCYCFICSSSNPLLSSWFAQSAIVSLGLAKLPIVSARSHKVDLTSVPQLCYMHRSVLIGSLAAVPCATNLSISSPSCPTGGALRRVLHALTTQRQRAAPPNLFARLGSQSSCRLSARISLAGDAP